jgi:hypothetical protein
MSFWRMLLQLPRRTKTTHVLSSPPHSTLLSFALSCTEICVRGNPRHGTDISGIVRLELTLTVTCDPELDFKKDEIIVTFLKQNWVMSAEWSTLDSLRPFLCYSKTRYWP